MMNFNLAEKTIPPSYLKRATKRRREQNFSHILSSILKRTNFPTMQKGLQILHCCSIYFARTFILEKKNAKNTSENKLANQSA